MSLKEGGGLERDFSLGVLMLCITLLLEGRWAVGEDVWGVSEGWLWVSHRELWGMTTAHVVLCEVGRLIYFILFFLEVIYDSLHDNVPGGEWHLGILWAFPIVGWTSHKIHGKQSNTQLLTETEENKWESWELFNASVLLLGTWKSDWSGQLLFSLKISGRNSLFHELQAAEHRSYSLCSLG